MSQENDILQAFGKAKKVTTFNENDVLKKLRLTDISGQDLQDLPDLQHLKVLREIHESSLQKKIEKS